MTNSDNDAVGITVSSTSGLVSTEAGGAATFIVVLDTQPTASVTIGLSSDDTGEGTVSPSTLTFSTGNWSTAQTVTVTGVDDAVADGNQSYTIVTAAAASSDTSYSGLNASDVSVTNSDNDYTVTFYKNDSSATGTMLDQAIASGSTANLTANAFSKSGWSFTGWATTSSGSVSHTNGASFNMDTSNVTLYAVWSLLTYSLQFDGLADRVNIGDISELRTPSAMSVSFWFKRRSDKPDSSNHHETSNVMYAKASNANNDNIEIGTDGGLVEIYLHTTASDGSVAPSNKMDSFDAGITNDTWYHLAFTYDSSEGRLYIDGTKVNSWSHWGGALVSSAGSPLTIGDTDHIETPFDGLIDDIAVWDTAISDTEVSDIFGGTSPSSTASSNLVGYWSLNEGSGGIITDLSSGGNHGMLNGASWSTDTPR